MVLRAPSKLRSVVSAEPNVVDDEPRAQSVANGTISRECVKTQPCELAAHRENHSLLVSSANHLVRGLLPIPVR
jgi:hypothetical protein